MYNLFVTADTQAWNEANGSYEFTRSRFLEHTEDKLVRKYKDLTKGTNRGNKRITLLISSGKFAR